MAVKNSIVFPVNPVEIFGSEFGDFFKYLWSKFPHSVWYLYGLYSVLGLFGLYFLFFVWSKFLRNW